MTDAYRTAANRSDARFEVNGSEFVGHISPVEMAGEAETLVTEIEKCHPDATYNIPVYRVPAESASLSVPGERSVMLREHQSDDGESSGLPGKPVPNVLVR